MIIDDREILSLVTVASTTGQTLADGSAMESGIHLRWHPGPDVGFPPGGFDVFRREHSKHEADSFVGFNELTETTLSGAGWTLLTADMPINLPITATGWPGTHAHSPHDLAEAVARIPSSLAPKVRSRYRKGFDSDLATILQTLVTTVPQQDARLSENGVAESRMRTTRSAPLFETKLLGLLSLLSIDPNMARILGLYFVDDTAVSGAHYDYLVVGHYQNRRVPARRIIFEEVAPGSVGPSFVTDGVGAVTSPRAMTLVEGTWDGNPKSALRFAYDGDADSVWISIDGPCKSLEFRLSVSGAPTEATIEGFTGSVLVANATVAAGEHTILLDASTNIDNVLVTIRSEFDLFSISLRSETGTMGDVGYLVHNVTTDESDGVPTPVFKSASAFQLPTRVSGDRVEPESSAVALALEIDASSPASGANRPILYRFRRTDLEDKSTIDLNLDRPTLIGVAKPTPGPRPRSVSSAVHYVDARVASGSYAYLAQGIDLFGRLSAWSDESNVDLSPVYGPPPPSALAAKYLDALDARLTTDEKTRVDRDGNGLLLSWTWTGMQRVQAPMMEKAGAEFRFYDIADRPNTLRGTITNITDLGDTSELQTTLIFGGAVDSLAGLNLRCGPSFFSIESNTRGNNITITVRHLSNPMERPESADCSIAIPRGNAAWMDLRKASNWTRQVHSEPTRRIPTVKGNVSSAIGVGTTRAKVKIDATLADDSTLIPGILLVDGTPYPVMEHTAGATAALLIELPSLPDGSVTAIPTVGKSARYLPGKTYSIYLDDYELAAIEGQAIAYATIGASAYCSEIEGAVGRPATVTEFHREAPAAPAVERTDDDEWTVAEPADYYGYAKHTISWPAVTGAYGYLVYRATGASLFDNDREQRRMRVDDYTADSFADDPGYDDWKLSAYPDMDMFKDLEAASADEVSTVLAAWREWADRFYPTLTPAQVQTLASKACNRTAFRRVNTDPTAATFYEDRFAARGDGFNVWRIRAVNASSVPGDWSSALEPVRIFDVTPPAAPKLTSVLGSTGGVVLAWRAVADDDVVKYEIYRAESAEELADIRREDPILTIDAAGSGADPTATDESAAPLTTYFYCVVAVDDRGNRSSPSRALQGRAIAATPPPPGWISGQWTDDGVELIWSMDSGDLQTLVERRVAGTAAWLTLGTWLDAGVASYVDTDAARDADLEFRLRVKSASGVQSSVSGTMSVAMPA